MKKNHYIPIILAILLRGIIPHLDLFLIMYFVLQLFKGADKGKLLLEFSIAAFAYSFLFESIIGVFPLVFILISAAVLYVANIAPRLRAISLLLPTLGIITISMLPNALAHLLNNGKIFFQSYDIKTAMVTTMALWIIQAYLTSKSSKI